MNTYLSYFNEILHGPISYAFVYIALPASVFFVFLVAMSLFSEVMDSGGDSIDTDVDSHSESDWSFVKFLTLKNVVYFLTFFSWTGIVALEHTFSETSAVIIASITGLVFTTFLNMLFMFLVKSEKVVIYDLNKLLNNVGTVYLSMDKDEIGQIQIELNGALETIDSKNVSDRKLIAGEQVKVTAIVGKLLHVSSI